MANECLCLTFSCKLCKMVTTSNPVSINPETYEALECGHFPRRLSMVNFWQQDEVSLAFQILKWSKERESLKGYSLILPTKIIRPVQWIVHGSAEVTGLVFSSSANSEFPNRSFFMKSKPVKRLARRLWQVALMPIGHRFCPRCSHWPARAWAKMAPTSLRTERRSLRSFVWIRQLWSLVKQALRGSVPIYRVHVFPERVAKTRGRHSDGSRSKKPAAIQGRWINLQFVDLIRTDWCCMPACDWILKSK